jgi:hypothetical protein
LFPSLFFIISDGDPSFFSWILPSIEGCHREITRRRGMGEETE